MLNGKQIKMSKYTWVFILGVAFLFTIGSATAQKKGKEVNAVQIAHITYDSILVNLKEYPKTVKLIEAYQKQLVSEFELKSLEFDAAVENYQSQESQLTEDERTNIIQKLQKMRAELNTLKEDFDKKIFAKEKELIIPLNAKIEKAINAVATKNGFSHVVEKKNFYFVLDSFDVTQLVIEEANKM